ncbi:MAG: ABC transporter ATP-binding protein [Vicinamibacterales bacterium]
MTGSLWTENLGKRFGRTRVLDGLTFSVEEGSVYGLVGPNGAGKTTTVKILMNIVPPSSGRAVLLGTASGDLSARQFQQIGYVSEGQELPGWMTVDYFMAYLRPFYPSWDDRRADELLTQLALPRDRKLKHLSRGMRMKVALASSLAYRPKLLVLDEPFTGLDPFVRDEFIEGLVESAQETTMLISSHDLAEIESFATHIGYLDRGRLQFSQSMASLTERFREVEVIVDREATLPPAWPAHWLRPEAAASVVRFVDSRFNQEQTIGQLRHLFGDMARIAVTPMSLRAIFVTLARESRKSALEA